MIPGSQAIISDENFVREAQTRKVFDRATISNQQLCANDPVLPPFKHPIDALRRLMGYQDRYRVAHSDSQVAGGSGTLRFASNKLRAVAR